MRIIVNADDFGRDEPCSRAMLEAINKGICSSVTAIMNGSFVEESLRLLEGKKCSVGLHINLTQGCALSPDMRASKRFCDEDGCFRPHVFSKLAQFARPEQELLACEIRAQIAKLRSFGWAISHADSHHHVHTFPSISGIVFAVLAEQGVARLRLAQNLGLSVTGCGSLAKKIYRIAYNHRLKGCFSSTDYFSDVTTFLRCRSQLSSDKVCEVMIHAEYDENGVLVEHLGGITNRLEALAGSSLITYDQVRKSANATRAISCLPHMKGHVDVPWALVSSAHGVRSSDSAWKNGVCFLFVWVPGCVGFEKHKLCIPYLNA